MKKSTKTVLTMLALGASTWVATAQQDNGPGAGAPPPGAQIPGAQVGPGGPGGPGGAGPRGMRRPLPPVFLALDTNHDGVIEPNEIANAPEALKSLLKNGATNLTVQDLMGPPQFRRMGGPGGFGGPGGRGPGGFGGPGGGMGPGPGGFGGPMGRGPGGPGGGGVPVGPGGPGNAEDQPPGPPPGAQ